MYNNFDFNSKKYMLLLVIICTLFAILIIKAFDYLPDKNVTASSEPAQNLVTGSNAVNSVNSVSNTVNPNNQNNNVKDNSNEQKSGVLYRNPDLENITAEENVKFEEIDAPKGVIEEEQISKDAKTTPDTSLTPDENALKSIMSARKYIKAGDNSNAISEYMKAVELTKDEDILAECYDGLAELYAKNKKYGTSLTFATKAYKSSPSSQREFQIAKIYYAAGKTETAITRLNNLLKRNLNTP